MNLARMAESHPMNPEECPVAVTTLVVSRVCMVILSGPINANSRRSEHRLCLHRHNIGRIEEQFELGGMGKFPISAHDAEAAAWAREPREPCMCQEARGESQN